VNVPSGPTNPMRRAGIPAVLPPNLRWLEGRSPPNHPKLGMAASYRPCDEGLWVQVSR
jgi:hypothetical protein